MWHSNKIKTLFFVFLLSALSVAGCDGLPFPSQATPTPEPVEIEDTTPLVSATGVVLPLQYNTLSMSTAGLVTEVLVAEGDQVEEGQVLVRLKGREELQSAIAAAKFELASAEKAINDLHDQAETASTAALEAISHYEKQVRDAQYQLDNFTPPSEQKDMDPWEAVEIMKARLDQAREAFEPYRERSSGDPTRKDLKEDLDEAQSDYNAAVRRLEYVTELEVAEANLEKAKDDYDTFKDGPDPEAVAVAEARLENARAALEAAQSTLQDLELLALFSGTVTELHTKVGEWVVPGQPILQLADLAHLRVETTDLNEIDAARVEVGENVTITFDALEDVVQGTVVSIAPKASAGSGVNYSVVIELDELPAALRWGMTAFVDIEVE